MSGLIPVGILLPEGSLHLTDRSLGQGRGIWNAAERRRDDTEDVAETDVI